MVNVEIVDCVAKNMAIRDRSVRCYVVPSSPRLLRWHRSQSVVWLAYNIDNTTSSQSDSESQDANDLKYYDINEHWHCQPPMQKEMNKTNQSNNNNYKSTPHLRIARRSYTHKLSPDNPPPLETTQTRLWTTWHGGNRPKSNEWRTNSRELTIKSRKHSTHKTHSTKSTWDKPHIETVR